MMSNTMHVVTPIANRKTNETSLNEMARLLEYKSQLLERINVFVEQLQALRDNPPTYQTQTSSSILVLTVTGTKQRYQFSENKISGGSVANLRKQFEFYRNCLEIAENSLARLDSAELPPDVLTCRNKLHGLYGAVKNKIARFITDFDQVERDNEAIPKELVEIQKKLKTHFSGHISPDLIEARSILIRAQLIPGIADGNEKALNPKEAKKLIERLFDSANKPNDRQTLSSVIALLDNFISLTDLQKANFHKSNLFPFRATNIIEKFDKHSPGLLVNTENKYSKEQLLLTAKLFCQELTESLIKAAISARKINSSDFTVKQKSRIENRLPSKLAALTMKFGIAYDGTLFALDGRSDPSELVEALADALERSPKIGTLAAPVVRAALPLAQAEVAKRRALNPTTDQHGLNEKEEQAKLIELFLEDLGNHENDPNFTQKVRQFKSIYHIFHDVEQRQKELIELQNELSFPSNSFKAIIDCYLLSKGEFRKWRSGVRVSWREKLKNSPGAEDLTNFELYLPKVKVDPNV